MRAPPATLAITSMPEFRERRTAPPHTTPSFAAQLSSSLAAPTAPPSTPRGRNVTPFVGQPPRHAAPRAAAGVPSPATRAGAAPDNAPTTKAPLDPADVSPPAAPLSPQRGGVVRRAQQLLGVPYVFGGNSPTGLDCSSYLSRAWGVSRQTTDTLSTVADNIDKDDLRAGDAMNLPSWNDPEHVGHVRMFDRWADQAHSKVWVYEETSVTGQSVHRVIPYDDRYQPMRLRSLAED